MRNAELSRMRKAIQLAYKQEYNESVALKDINVISGEDNNEDEFATKFAINVRKHNVFHYCTYNAVDGSVTFDNRGYDSGLVASLNDNYNVCGFNAADVSQILDGYMPYIDSNVITEKEVNASIASCLLAGGNTTITNSKLLIAKALYYIYANELYKVFGFQNIYDYGANMFDLSRGSVSSYISIASRFFDTKYIINIDTLTNALIKEPYYLYSFTQLNLIKGLSDSEIQALELSPTMSTRTISELINSARAIADKETSETDNDAESVSDDDIEGEVEESGETEEAVHIPRKASTAPNLTLTVSGYSQLLSNEELLKKILKNGQKCRIEFYYEAE